MYREVLENPTQDDIPAFPGTTKYNWNMDCTNYTDPNRTSLVYDCNCTNYYDGSVYECTNHTEEDRQRNGTRYESPITGKMKNYKPWYNPEKNRTYIDYETAEYILETPYVKNRYFLYRNTTNCTFLMNRPSKISWLSPYVSMQYAFFYKYNASDPNDTCT